VTNQRARKIFIGPLALFDINYNTFVENAAQKAKQEKTIQKIINDIFTSMIFPSLLSH